MICQVHEEENCNDCLKLENIPSVTHLDFIIITKFRIIISIFYIFFIS
jgi:hypothetical protein